MIGVHYVVVARERRHQHDQRAFGKVKIGDKAVENFELIARVDEDIRETLAGLYFTVLCCHALQRAAGGGADCDNTAAVRFRFVDQASGFLGNFVMLAVHLVFGHIIHLYRSEGTQAHMERHIGDVNTFLPDAFHQLLGEVQPCGRSCGGTQLVTVDSLIALLVLQLLGDVRGKRHLSYFIERGEKAFVTVKIHHAVAVVLYSRDRRRQQTVPKGKVCSLARLFARLAECFPAVTADLTEQQKFHPRARFVLYAVNPGGQHARIVGDNQITLVEIIDDIAEAAVLHASAASVKNQQTRAVARFNGSLRYQLFGQVVVKITCFHSIFSPFSGTVTKLTYTLQNN